jgi:pimeloyl-ACP methyl ester carboxylesterase
VVTYGLIHGAHHGAWCWDFLRPELEARTHRVVAVDLPCEDPTAGVFEYSRVTIDALTDVTDELVLVGHSLGGIVAPVVATHRPVSRLIYLSAWAPEPGRSLAEQQADEPDAGTGGRKIDNGDGTWSRAPDEAVRVYYHDCSEERQRYALARLRPQSRAPNEERTPLAALPDVPASFVLTLDDRANPPDRQRRMAQRLGIEPIEIPGSHSPFLARPSELADVFDQANRLAPTDAA